MKTKWKWLNMLCAVILVFALYSVQASATIYTVNFFDPDPGYATPASDKGMIPAVSYEDNRALNGWFSSVDEEIIGYEAEFTAPAGISDYGTVTYDTGYVVYTPSAEVAGQTVDFTVYAKGSVTEKSAGVDYTVHVGQQPLEASSNTDLASVSYQVDGQSELGLLAILGGGNLEATSAYIDYTSNTGGSLTGVGAVEGAYPVSALCRAILPASGDSVDMTVSLYNVPSADQGSAQPYKTITVHVVRCDHEWSDEWSSDADSHWHECVNENCPETDNSRKDGYSAHEFKWVTDKEATETESGWKHEECSVCGYQKAKVEIPALEESETPVESETPEESETPVESETTAIWPRGSALWASPGQPWSERLCTAYTTENGNDKSPA